jgi:hypothetical protein
LQYYSSAIKHTDYTQKTITPNESLFRAYPAANPEAPRGKTDVFFILADAFDHHTRRQQEDMLSVITPYRPETYNLLLVNTITNMFNQIIIYRIVWLMAASQIRKETSIEANSLIRK